MAEKIATEIEDHPEFRRKGLSVYLKGHCLQKDLQSKKEYPCCLSLTQAQVIIPIFSSTVYAGDETDHFLTELELALQMHSTSTCKIIPVFALDANGV